MASHHHLPATAETVHWGYWDAARAPVLHIASGDTVTIDTLSGEPEDLHPDAALLLPEHRAVLAESPRGSGPHLLTGPVHVEGAEPGDVLEVRIHDVTLRQDWGWNIIEPLLGTLPEDFPLSRRLHIPLDRTKRTASLPWGLELPLDPFFGNFGVAPPPQYGRVTSIIPREFGGNLDNKALTAGTTVYFPVFNRGALFSAGDGHAAQGDGEVCLTAIETSLTGTFEFVVRKDLQLRLPRAETATHYIAMGLNEDLDDAARQALRQMIAWITELSGLPAVDAYTLCSIAADLRVTQMVDVNKGVHCMLPKSALPNLLAPA
ncbi:acetamidase/formamidase family protein [Aquabacterium sp. J223]|uniref:acetamidase/formamidase family protein n=1 Tax=Aquabacterium sp. J223 TaxID=2898431 RepID=UPI0021AD6F5B|nr:acetamidase/formamidase family protein [Aquabacterium sp. J223]UUX96465.1 acetamidase/formamidase family protein [Aquabacterium sp. J223]